jgi:chromosome segregation ATPase
MEAGKPQKPEEGDAAKPKTGSQEPVKPQTTEEQIEGLRAWIAQIDRKLGIRSLAGALAIVLALAAGIVGVVLAMSAKDESATKAEVDSLAEQVSASTKEVSQAAEDDLSAINDRIEALESRVATVASSQRTTESEIQVLQDDIDELRTDVSDIETRVGELEAAPPPDTGNNN